MKKKLISSERRKFKKMANNSIQVSPEWNMAIYDSIRILLQRGYLHNTKDVEFVRPYYKPVFSCPHVGSEGLIDLGQLKWAADKGDFWFIWYQGSFLRLNLNKGTVIQELTLDPTKENVWEFVRKIDSNYK
jgi:hypothetical protein